ncbi:DNA-directed RNA polymerase subunit beta [Frankliniella fusca]|uniref:DNA-directed RNA polymerase subunit beta n=1 Tax=Frankliniella fusca TaxID=407009 RepID=A0AAE1H5B6_9NEOP|nr:DNA-directed RNA polymerase subunit beta [Frankliniella fusca]
MDQGSLEYRKPGKSHGKEKLSGKVDRAETPPLDVEAGGVDAAEEALAYAKKARLEELSAAQGGLPGAVASVAAAPTTYLPYPPEWYWYDTWALSAFRPWPSIFTATKDGKTAPMPFLREG